MDLVVLVPGFGLAVGSGRSGGGGGGGGGGDKDNLRKKKIMEEKKRAAIPNFFYFFPFSFLFVLMVVFLLPIMF